ncbi:MAG: TonB-dependent receptor [Oleispira sp.]|nr:TonB-dependent receptor [Oleispira sp.]MBL4880404.1 TonB-dependent receptor [Oleispira sp.]
MAIPTPQTMIIPVLFTSAIAYAEVELDSISINASKEETSIEESGFNIEVIDTSEYLNSNKDINQVLNQTAGINIRSIGGLGSDFDLSLNGLSDKQIRYFIDGIPMEDFGSALSLNNFPINLVEGIEVYKGVVPISLGADALGGAINIVTPNLDEDFIDTSYSYGSFNTHRLALVAQTSNLDGYFLRTSGYLNTSDNNYTMKSVPVTDDLGNVLGTTSAERFNDEYQSRMLTLKAGRIDASWADEISLSLTYADNENNHQHPDTSTNIVFGKVHSKNTSKLISANYAKRFEKLSVKSYFLAGQITETFYDTYSRSYDWQGSFVDKSSPSQGELGNRSQFKLTDDVIRLSIGGDYRFNNSSILSMNLTANNLDRKGNEKIDVENTSFTHPNSIQKSILGINQSFFLFDDALNINAFVKQYDYHARIISDQDIDGIIQNSETKADISNTGYGTGLSYQLNNSNKLKTSYEKTYRLPEADEILGDGMYIRPNPDLKAETSHNLNLGLISQLTLADSSIRNEVNVFYRNASDFIRYVPDQVIKGIYKNTKDVEVTGIENSFSLIYQQFFDFQINATYQDIINKSKTGYNGLPDTSYNSRIPNEPYLFANLRMGLTYFTDDYHKISTHWSSHYVEQYFLYSEGSGDKDHKREIPEQLTHDIDIEYSIDHNKYNIGFTANNIFDETVFDNYNIQKPGRAYYLKFRYSI